MLGARESENSMWSKSILKLEVTYSKRSAAK